MNKEYRWVRMSEGVVRGWKTKGAGRDERNEDEGSRLG